jgi:hypothetical protein
MEADVGLRLVNTFPGSIKGPLLPGVAAHLGLKSETSKVSLSSLNVKMGMTSLVRGSSIPEDDQILRARGATVFLQTTERRVTVSNQIAAAIVSNSLHLQKNDDSDNNLCVYEISVPINVRASALAHVRLRKSTWTTFAPDWVSLPNMTGVYLGLEHGGYGTALYTFLRNAGGGGSLVVGGPLQTFGEARPAQAELTDFQWAALDDETTLDLWIYFNSVGYASPFSPAHMPVAEVWTQRAGIDDSPVVQAIIPVADLDSFPSGRNYRPPNAEPVLRLFLGNAGRSGDLVKIDDFAIYPDFRFAVRDGVALSNTILKSVPDVPLTYRATERRTPRDVAVGRWAVDGLAPADALKFLSAERQAARHLSITKEVAGRMAYVKEEPAVEEVNGEPSMIEAVLVAEPVAYDGVLFGGGIAIDDGESLYQVGMLKDGAFTTFGIAKVLEAQTSLSGFHVPLAVYDLSIPHLVRLVVDRPRELVKLYVDEEIALSIDMTETFPASEDGIGKVRFGHVFDSASTGRLDVKLVNVLSSFISYEVDDGLPDASTPAFVDESTGDDDGSSDVVDDLLVITKADFTDTDVVRLHRQDYGLSDLGGLLLDFKARVVSFTDNKGTQFSPNSSTGVGVSIQLESKKLELVFVNCGVHGKKVGIVPGDGSIDDIIEQTDLGRKYSAPASWDELQNYRLVVRAGNLLELWAGNLAGAPILVVPWDVSSAGFGLPAVNDTPAIQFGHIQGTGSSISEWEYVRCGASRGFEVSVAPQFDELHTYLFGGRALVLAEFDED